MVILSADGIHIAVKSLPVVMVGEYLFYAVSEGMSETNQHGYA
jgi:hypothetical protein